MSDIIAKLEDLLKQATTERSHYYVAGCCKEAIAEIRHLQRYKDLEAMSAMTCQGIMDEAVRVAVAKERTECARMVREHARAISKGSFPKPRSAEEWGEVLAKHIEIPF